MVLTTAYNYTEQDILPFLRSLFETGYKGDVAIVVEPNTKIKGVFEGHEIKLLKSNGDKRLHLNCWRFVDYLQFLNTRWKDEPVVLADARDTIFQKNPDDCLPGVGVHGYCEDNSMSIGKCPYNSRWTRLVYGPDYLEKHSRDTIICAGTICGSVAPMRAYLRAMIALMRATTGEVGVDQAVHNGQMRRLGYPVHVNGPTVFTVGYVPEDKIHISVTGDIKCELLGKRLIPAIVHQYDRFPKLMELVKGRFAA